MSYEYLERLYLNKEKNITGEMISKNILNLLTE